ncbi:hypothetical protein [Rhizobium sp. Leaf391]|uniref:hypothetical protein n=1 Tax=Rhizobium sp. Leaf391 TaxID=1736360 RepID=UPI000A73039D
METKICGADGQVRQAAFKGLREDKPAGEVEAKKPISPEEVETPQPERPVATKVVHRKGAKAEVMGVMISNPDKLFWPDANDGEPVTKEELVKYHEEVGSG